MTQGYQIGLNLRLTELSFQVSSQNRCPTGRPHTHVCSNSCPSKGRMGYAVMIKEIYHLRAQEIISQVSKRFSYLSPSLPNLLLRGHREEKSREIPVCNLIAIELIFEPPSDNRLHIILRLLCVLCS